MHNQAQTIPNPKAASAATEVSDLRVLIAAGGTGGHVYPAIAIADALKDLHANSTIKFVGTKDRMEWQAVPKAGYEIVSIWISGFHRRLTAKNLLFPLKVMTSLVQSIQIISSFKPDVMICCGGYVAGPVGWIAAKKKVPLFIQEQNSYPGVTNRMLAPKAELIFTAFKEADDFLPAGKTVLAGNPTRKSLTDINKAEACRHFNFDEELPTLLILGGSGGARTINEATIENLQKLHNYYQLQIIWQCGRNYYEEVQAKLNLDEYENLRLFDYLHHMPQAYAAADLAVSRAGALSCAELALTGVPAILIPSPNVAGDHQTKNAKAMADSGAAKVMKDEEAINRLQEQVKDLIFNQQKLKTMRKAALKLARPNAAENIAQKILGFINE